MRTVPLLFTVMLCSAFLLAEDATPKMPLISVTGTCRLDVAPDEIKITVDIDNRDKLLQVAKEKTDAQAKKLIALAAAAGIQPTDTITSYVTIDPARSARRNEGRTIVYFRAGQRVTLTLRDFSKYETLMNGLIAAGFGDALVEYSVSDLPAYRKQARVTAMLAAQEKAKLLAEAVGQKIGKAYAIKEITTQPSGGVAPNLYISNAAYRVENERRDDSLGPLTFGNIPVTVTVEVTFLLE
jgi:uncharacterized protein YggE